MILDTPEIQLFYTDRVNGSRPIVMLHGTTGWGESFDPLVPWLEKGHRILIPDLRGHGRSDHVTAGYRVVDFAKDIIALLEQLVSKPAILLGHSLGGLVAISVAAERADLVSGVTIEDAPLWLRRVSVKDGSERAYTFFSTLHAILEQTQYEPEIEQRIRQELPEAFERETADLAERLALLDPDVLRMSFDSSLMDGLDLDASLAKIECPTLLIQADPAAGGSLPDEDVQAVLKLLKRGSHRFATGAGHLIHRDRPAEMASIIKDWLREN